MAFLHRVWTYQPVRVHEEIADRVVVDGGVDPHRLRQLARDVVAIASVGEYLEMIRYDESWLEEDEIGEAHLYVVSMGARLQPARNMRWPGLMVHYLREQLSWPDEDAWRLLRGDPLSTVPIDDRLMNVIRPELVGQFGGWLSKDSSAVALESLQGVGERFHDPHAGGLAWVRSWSGGNEQDARAALAGAYEDACAVLSSLDRLQPDFALRCVAD